MKKARFTEEQIIGVLKQHEAGRQGVYYAAARMTGRDFPASNKRVKGRPYGFRPQCDQDPRQANLAFWL